MAILVVARCNVREVSEWAGHNNVAFTLTRYGEFLEDGSDGVICPPLGSSAGEAKASTWPGGSRVEVSLSRGRRGAKRCSAVMPR